MARLRVSLHILQGKGRWLIVPLLFLLGWQTAAQRSATTPKIVREGGHAQLLVEGKPFLILGGELGNSSASSPSYLRSLWPKLEQLHLNTVISPVYWELIEPVEGQFDFSSVDSLIGNARRSKMKLVLLWFGAWKNSMSCYAPGWVKTNVERFPRATDRSGSRQEILTPFHNRNLEADRKALVALMRHLKKVDAGRGTILALQIENEIGMLPDARSYDEDANRNFSGPVPEALLDYLAKNENGLTPVLRLAWEKNGKKHAGSWEEVFGKSLFTDEIFMAWSYARFVNELAAAALSVYPLPLYVNAALNRPGLDPGQYPSAGPLPHLMDIWKAGAPLVDVFAPDFYNPDFAHWCDLYTRDANPLFIPEIRLEQGIDAKAFFAFGHYDCLAFSPFSIESTQEPGTEPIGKAYQVLEQLSGLITKYRPLNRVRGFLLDKDSASTVVMGKYRLVAKHEYTLGWSPNARSAGWPLAGGLVIATGPDEFYVAGTGLVITFESVEANRKAGFLTIDEGEFIRGKWSAGRRLNGDQDHQGRHVRIPVGEYGIQHVRLYTY